MMRHLTTMAVLAQMITNNSFEEKLDEINELFSRVLFPEKERQTVLLHLGKGLTVSEITSSTYNIGTDKRVYVKATTHDVELSGIVSVRMSLDTETGVIAMDVYPASEEMFIGMLWMDNVAQSTGSSVGDALFWSEKKLNIPIAGSIPSTMGNSLQGFSFGFTLRNETINTMQMLGNIFEPIRFLTPLGVSDERFPSHYPIGKIKVSLSRPVDISEIRFSILKKLYKDGVCSFTARHIREMYDATHDAEYDTNDIVAIHMIVNQMVHDEWFDVLKYDDRTFYVPTTKLLKAIR